MGVNYTYQISLETINMNSNLAIFSLEYTYLVNSHRGMFESNSGLWQDHSEWSRALIPYQILDHHPKEDIRVMDNLSHLRSKIMDLNYNGMADINHIKLMEPQLGNNLFTISISGNETFVNSSKSEILKAYKKISFKRLTLSARELNSVGTSFLHHLNSIALQSGVEIFISDHASNFKGSYARSNDTFLYMMGDTTVLNMVETNVGILIDSLLNGCFIERVSVPVSMVPCLGGVSLSAFTEIARDLSVKLFLPDLSEILSINDHARDRDELTIWMTSSNIAEISHMRKTFTNLLQIIQEEQARTGMYFSQEVQLCKDKLDFILLHHNKDILKVLTKQRTHAQKTLSETHEPVIFINGQTSASVTESVKQITSLCYSVYQLDLEFSRDSSATDLEYYFMTILHMKSTCSLIHTESGISILGMKKEIHALMNGIVSDLQNHQFLFNLLSKGKAGFQINLKMELAHDQKDFLSGKKNGKVVKIFSQVGNVPAVEFRMLTSLTFSIESSVKLAPGMKNRHIITAFEILLRTICLIEMEFPAELQFNVPEVFHKSLIGNGGSIIQSISKKYNVFIKFSKAGASTETTGHLSNERNFFSLNRGNNVLIKCPMKNMRSIMLAKQEIDHLVQQCCQNRSLSINGTSVNYNTVKFKLMKSDYLLLLRERRYDLKFVSDLESSFSTYIDFPKSIDAFDGSQSFIMMIKGNDSSARACAEELANSLPKSHEIIVEGEYERLSAKIGPQSEDFKQDILLPLRSILLTEVLHEQISSGKNGLFSCHIFLSSFAEQNLATAVQELILHLRGAGLNIPRSQSVLTSPIVLVDEIAPAGVLRRSNSPVKYLQRSSERSQKQSFRSSSTSPKKRDSPMTNEKKPLGVITNQSSVPTLKSLTPLRGNNLKELT